MRKIIVTVESTDESDLDWLKDRIDGAVAEVIEDNASRMDGEVVHATEWAD